MVAIFTALILLAWIKPRWALVLLPLLLSGCAVGTVQLAGTAADMARTPRNNKFDDTIRAALGEKPDSAVVAGATAKRFNHSGQRSVYLTAVDGRKADPLTWTAVQYVRAGPHRVVVRVEGTGLVPGEYIPPEIEVTFLAQHCYQITATRTDQCHWVQFWDETDGTERRTLVKEFRADLPYQRNWMELPLLLLPAIL